MPGQEIQGPSGNFVDVGGKRFKGLHAHIKPIEYGDFGHYRVTHRTVLLAAQTAASRLFEVRNTTDTAVIIPTRLAIRWIQTAAHTAAIEDSLDVYKVVSFSAVDTTNTATPTQVVMRTTGMVAVASDVAAIRGLQAAGLAAGMTGGTLTKEGGPLAQLPQWLLAAVPTAGTIAAQTLEEFGNADGQHPLVLEKNQGLIIENRVLLGAAAGSTVYIDLSYAVAPSF